MNELEEKHRVLICTAKEGDRDAMYELATACHTLSAPPYQLLNGYLSAIEWAMKALELNHPWAGTLLGNIYSNPNFEAASDELALDYYKRSAELGHDYAKDRIEELNNSGNKT